jgi:HSP20 family molecular chaperone IbpA
MHPAFSHLLVSEQIDADKMSADLENGVLTVRLPRHIAVTNV